MYGLEYLQEERSLAQPHSSSKGRLSFPAHPYSLRREKPALSLPQSVCFLLPPLYSCCVTSTTAIKLLSEIGLWLALCRLSGPLKNFPNVLKKISNMERTPRRWCYHRSTTRKSVFDTRQGERFFSSKSHKLRQVITYGGPRTPPCLLLALPKLPEF